MTQFAMTTRTGSVVIKTQANNLEEAINYFAKIIFIILPLILIFIFYFYLLIKFSKKIEVYE